MAMGKKGAVVTLGEAVAAMRAADSTLIQEIRSPRRDPKDLFRPLVSLVLSLGTPRAAKPVHCPEEYIRQWQDLLGGRRDYMEPRALRYLCWHPEVAVTSRFHHYLDEKEVDLSGRSLQGLIRCCHAKWSKPFRSSQTVIRVRDRLRRYSGPNRLLAKWRDNRSTILGNQGDEEFAKSLVDSNLAIKQFCELWGVEEPSAYVCEAARNASEYCRLGMARRHALLEYLLAKLLPWPHWRIESYRAEVRALILSPLVVQGSEAIRNSIVEFVLRDKRLGDPRQGRNRVNWVGAEDASRRVIEWLGRADIIFFFEHVLPHQTDTHRRKEFWLQYVSRLDKSRVFLYWADEARLRSVLKEAKDKIQFGKIRGGTSAFLLDFGPIVVAEFSRVGNACYIYERNAFETILPDFWVLNLSHESKLKQPQLCIERVVHRDGWQDGVRSLLARYGIRP